MKNKMEFQEQVNKIHIESFGKTITIMATNKLMETMDEENQYKLRMWQKLLIGEITQEEFTEWLKINHAPFLELQKVIEKDGLEKTFNELNPVIDDPEFIKLKDYYLTHQKLLSNYILSKSKEQENEQSKS